MDKTEQAIITQFAVRLADIASDFFGEVKIREVVGSGPTEDIFFKKYQNGFIGKKLVQTPFPADFSPEIFSQKIEEVVSLLVKAFGPDFTDVKLDIIYGELEHSFRLDLVSKVVIPFVPKGFLESRRLQYLSKEDLEREVLRKTKELRKLNEALEDKVRERTDELRRLLEEQHKSARLLIRRDLELTTANEKLRELDDRKSEFLTIAAHQLRTPLSGIKWTLSMIVHGELGPISDDQKVFLMKSYESNERMINLVEDMLHADRIDSGKYHLNLVSTQVLDIVDSVLYEVLPDARKKSVTIELARGAGDIPPARVDQEKMRAVFQNLLENAVKYSKVGGKITISAEREVDFLKFAIKDDGIGIPEDQQGNIFSRFFRARNALKTETDGTGLGLFIVKSIIERHGGRVWYDSKEGEGSTFYFTIKI